MHKNDEIDETELDFSWPWGQSLLVSGFFVAMVLNLFALWTGPWQAIALLCVVASYLGARNSLIQLAETVVQRAEESKTRHNKD